MAQKESEVGGKEGGKLSPVAHLSQYFIVDTMLF
jgi:hypothetical protein